MPRSEQYVAAGVGVTWAPTVTLADNSGSVAGVPVSWTAMSGLTMAGGSVANAGGVATGAAMISPLGDGVRVPGSACAWAGTVCAGFYVVGVGADQLQVMLVSGGGQMIGATATLGPVTVQVTDASGHPVLGAVVKVYQDGGAGAGVPEPRAVSGRGGGGAGIEPGGVRCEWTGDGDSDGRERGCGGDQHGGDGGDTGVRFAGFDEELVELKRSRSGGRLGGWKFFLACTR